MLHILCKHLTPKCFLNDISLNSVPGQVKRERGRPAKDKDAKEKSHTPSGEGGKTKKHHGKILEDNCCKVGKRGNIMVRYWKIITVRWENKESSW